MNNKDRFKVTVEDMETKEKTTYYTNSEHLYQEALPSFVDGQLSDEVENVKLILQYASKTKRTKKKS